MSGSVHVFRGGVERTNPLRDPHFHDKVMATDLEWWAFLVLVFHTFGHFGDTLVTIAIISLGAGAWARLLYFLNEVVS